ncbi:MAG: hypothetical protein ABJG41_14745 [Cyclobacteriaceae bacterium]
MKTYYTILFTIAISTIALAQGAPPATPIDGGLSLLLAAGGAYGIKKLRDSRKK